MKYCFNSGTGFINKCDKLKALNKFLINNSMSNECYNSENSLITKCISLIVKYSKDTRTQPKRTNII